VKEAGDHHIVVGEIVAAAVRDDVRRAGTRDDLNPLYHLGGGVYAARGPRIEPGR
jgi:flavin reductase (DIM6/NTAB) family NADH-FMN oxidoreductase RutF